MKLILMLPMTVLIAACAAESTRPGTPLPAAPSQTNQPLERALVIGSAEDPDPVLTRIRELETLGVVKDVVVLESFPAQIHLTAPKTIIEELNRIPRVGGLR
jgi:hypothetical protein